MYILPQPVYLNQAEGTFLLEYHTYLVLAPESTVKIYRQACILQKEIARIIGCQPHMIRGKGRAKDIRIEYYQGECTDPQYYELEITKSGVRITGTEQSIIYGIQTFIQILEQTGPELPLIQLQDYPEMADRGFLFDISRGRVPKLSELKWLADQMMRYKLNQLHIYIEHTYLFRDFSEVWRDDTPITPEEIIELDLYCHDRGIELVPAIATGSHLYKILRTKQYRHLCELEVTDQDKFAAMDRQLHHTIDISNPDSIEFIKGMLNEFHSLFRSSKFNICADETFDIGKGKSRVFCAKNGMGRAYVSYVRQLCEHVSALGCEPMMWGDVIAEYPQLLKELPKEVTYLNWAYDADVTDELTGKFGRAGVKYYNCPGVNGWCRLVNGYQTAYENIRRMTVYGKKNGAAGILNTEWGDYYHTSHPGFCLIGLIYGAQFSWGKSICREDLNRCLSVLEFGKDNETLAEILCRVEENCLYTFMELCVFKESMPEGIAYVDFIKQGIDCQARVDALENANRELEIIKKALMRSTVGQSPKKQEMINAYILAVDGCIYLNELGTIISKRELQKIETDRDESNRLAGAIENWFYYYKRTWREVSKESELGRIQSIIDGYCDYLRKGNK